MALELRQLCKRAGSEEHICDVSLEFEPGTFTVLLGPADAGKTSILRLVAGLDRPDAGSILLHDTDITALEVRERSVSFVYQHFVNYPTLSVFENIASPMRVRRQPADAIDASVHEIATLLGIETFLDRYPPSLSGGQQQRLAIARALAKDADVVLLDEPLASLDYKLREDLRRELPRIFRNTRKIVLYAATDPDEAFLLGGNTVVLHEGSVCQVGAARSIAASPVNLAAARSIAGFPLNLLPASLAARSIRLRAGVAFPVPPHMRSLPDGHYTLGLRAEQLSLQASTPAAAACAATVAVTEITGNESIVHLDLAGSNCVAVVEGTRAPAAGSSLDVFLDPERLFVFDTHGRTVAAPGPRPPT